MRKEVTIQTIELYLSNNEYPSFTLLLHKFLSSQHERNVQPPIIYSLGVATHSEKSSTEVESHGVLVHVRMTES